MNGVGVSVRGHVEISEGAVRAGSAESRVFMAHHTIFIVCNDGAACLAENQNNTEHCNEKGVICPHQRQPLQQQLREYLQAGDFCFRDPSDALKHLKRHPKRATFQVLLRVNSYALRLLESQLIIIQRKVRIPVCDHNGLSRRRQELPGLARLDHDPVFTVAYRFRIRYPDHLGWGPIEITGSVSF